VAERSALVRELERVDAQARVDGAGGARALGALVQQLGQALPETLDELPINHSGTHVDFMIGSPDLTVTGVRRDGTRHRILEGERWVL
jgi:leucyl aminopeptidase (aminopeptidase T)